jgi:SAM-dependent methyltransferase
LCEKKHWMVNNLETANDRNDYHFVQFNKYKAIQKKIFHSMLEIGCGPFTNARVITGICNINYCSLLDPLANEYLNHNFSYYDNKYIFSEYIPKIGKIVRKFFPTMFKSYLKLASHKTKIRNFYNIPAEHLPTNDKYDLITMINVIEHCFDVRKIFQNILKVSIAGSYFIFSDKLYEHDKIQELAENSYDAAHPIKVDRRVIEKYLNDNFNSIYKRVQYNSAFFEGEKIQWDDMYFIGIRKG